MVLLTIILYDAVAIIVTVAALLCASAGLMTGLLICGIVAGIALVSLGWVLAIYD